MLPDLQALGNLLHSNEAVDIAKSLTTANGFLGINLEAEAKLMLPLFAGLRNRLPVDTPKQGGAQAIWRMQLGYGGFDFAGNMGTAFGAVGGDATGNALTVQADYKTQAIKGDVQWEAIPQAQGFDDPLAIETNRALSTLIKLDELIALGGNEAAIAAPTGGVALQSGVVGAAFGPGTWHFKVTAITLQGKLANDGGNSNVGESLPSASIASDVVPAGGATFIDLKWSPVAGAVGYKVYAEAAAAGGTWFLVPVSGLTYKDGGAITLIAAPQTYVNVTHVRVMIPGNGANPVPPVADGTANANVYEGMIKWAEASTMYGQSFASGGSKIFTNQDGAPLTAGNKGITEFDNVLANLWNTWHISPSLILTSTNGTNHLTNQLATGSQYRIELAPERGNFVGGMFVGGYINKFASTMLPGQRQAIPVWSHPYMADGTYLFLSEVVPYTYSRESRGFALDVQTPYTYFDLARTTRSFPFDLFFTQTLKCYHPLAQAAIVGVRNE